MAVLYGDQAACNGCVHSGPCLARECARHRVLSWLTDVLGAFRLVEDGGRYVDARIEWRPWRWTWRYVFARETTRSA